MHIEYLSYAVIPAVAAHTVQIMQMCDAFTRAGHEVRLHARPGKQVSNVQADYGVSPDFDLCYHSTISKPGILRRAQYEMKLRGAVKDQRNIDILYGRDVFALLACLGLKIPFYYEVHAPALSSLHAFSERQVLGSSHLVKLVCISAALADEYQRRYPELHPDKICIAHDAASLSEHEDGAGSALEPVRAGAIQAGYFGTTKKGRGMNVILMLAKAFPDCDFHLVGDVSQISEPALLSMSNVKTYGHQPHAFIAQMQNQCDILLAPYQFDIESISGNSTADWCSPLKIFEYMRSGKAMMVGALPVLNEVLTHNVNCKLVYPEDMEAWRESFKDLLSRSSRTDIGERARQDFLSNHTWSRRVEHILAGSSHSRQ